MDEGNELGGYRLIRRLGTGGAGTVWLAEDGGGTRVALKVMHPALATSEESRARLEREVRTVNSVRSPFVAHIIDAEIDASQPFVVSEYVEGPTLAEILSSGPIPLRGVAALSYHLASTIAAVHHANIIHRDIKPSNIICSSRGPVLLDFGIAMAVDDQHLTRTGLVSGSAGYTAPELLRGKPATKESDWWAWCATLLSCATGRAPFGKGDVMATMMRVIEGEPDLAGLHPMVSDALGGGLSPNPNVRPSPSLIVAHLMSAVGWAPGELDYVTVNWAQLLDTGERTQMVNSDPQEIAAPPEWDEITSRPDVAGARPVTYPVHPRRDPSEFTAANDHTEQVDTESVSWGDDEWDEDTEEETWDEEASEGSDENWDESDEDDQEWEESDEDDQGDEDWDGADDEDQSWTGAEPADSTGSVQPYGQGGYPGQQGGYSASQAPFAGAQNAYGYPRGAYGSEGTAPSGRPVPMGAPQPGLAAPTGDPRAGMRVRASNAGQPPAWQARGQQYPNRTDASSASGSAWVSGGVLLLTLAALPLIFGLSGTLIVGVALTACGLVGAMDRWLERRREQYGPRASDDAAAIAMAPILLARSLGTTLLALAVGAVLPYLVWIVLSFAHDGSVQWGWPTEVATSLRLSRRNFWLSDPAGVIIVWALGASMLVTAWLVPFAADLRVGLAKTVRSSIRPIWGRALLSIGCVGFLLISWLIGTGGASN
ncbi:protein kinase domain-containing protein [uncultured Actinomyces sp.]|uniref:serine/threonine-protein kinase n=1 Tax=uncultured Actinomyces sp. TaxID=249061 RepID=UPI0028E90FF7|nr:protein kinase [uncultured Actinomyces sp.]